MNETFLLAKTPNEISHEIADNMRSRRKEGKLTQKQLSIKSVRLNLTKDYGEVEKLYRLMCFNVFAHNRDE